MKMFNFGWKKHTGKGSKGKDSTRDGKIVLSGSDSDFPNPGRGWYRIYTFHLENIDYTGLNWLYYSENETLALVLADIGAYRDRDIPEEALDFFGYILGFFAKKGMEIILRIVYDTEGNGMIREPSLFALVLAHMRQMGGIVKKHAQDIFLSQGLFVGSWGEMHTSKFLTGEKLRTLYNTWKEATGGSVWISFRRPVQIRNVCGMEENITSIGLFDDAMFASGTHLGTFGNPDGPGEEAGWEKPWCKSSELGFIGKLAGNVPCGGEAVAGDSFPAADDVVNILKAMNISYLNCIHDPKLLGHWKEQGFTNNMDLYSYISLHLGYRISVKEVKVHKGADTFLSIWITNSGFSCIYEETGFKLVVTDEDGSSREENIPFDMRLLKPGTTEEVKTGKTGTLKSGSRLYLELSLKRNNRSIRFANKDITGMDAGDRLFIYCHR